MTGAGELDGLTVVDITQNLAGPLCTLNLADHGADVVKIEPRGGDATRAAPPFAGGESVPFMLLNRNKRSVTLDLKDAADRTVLVDLIATADVVVESHRPGAMARLGLDWASLSPRFPRLIYASISGYGQTGPLADRGGFDIVAQGMSGLMAVNGPVDGAPYRLPIPVCDILAGLYATIGILAAVEARHRTGRGQYVDTSLLDAAAAVQVYEAAHVFTHATSPDRLGQAHRGAAPYQLFPTADGHVTIGAGLPHHFADLCRLAETSDLLVDPRFVTAADRVRNSEALTGRLSKATRARPTDWWLRELDRLGIPCGPVLNHDHLFAHPQIKHRRMVETVDHPTAGTLGLLGVPVKMSKTAGSIRRAAPLLGQHTDEIRAALADRMPKT